MLETTWSQKRRSTRAYRLAEAVSRTTRTTSQPSRSAHSAHSTTSSSTLRPSCLGSRDTRPYISTRTAAMILTTLFISHSRHRCQMGKPRCLKVLGKLRIETGRVAQHESRHQRPRLLAPVGDSLPQSVANPFHKPEP